MIANIVHTSLNPRGGSERLAITTMKALSEMNIGIDLTTCEKPNIMHLKRTYGQSVAAVIQKVRIVNTLQSLGEPNTKTYDFTINTHGDILPYFHPTFSKNNTITYCHFPLAKYLIDSKSRDYIRMLKSINLTTLNTSDDSEKDYYQSARNTYLQMMQNSTILTNSIFSQRAIWKAFRIDSTVLSPPVDVDFFRNAGLTSSSSYNSRKDTILVISRFNPTKKIENAIRLAKLLKQNKIGNGMKIVGNLSPEGFGYYSYLKEMVQNCGLADYVTFEINISAGKLLTLMCESKIYFHPLPGEPFGISTVEAMSAGLIPVVPDIGGHTEFVPPKYQIHTFGEGVEAIASALDAPYSERISISDSVKKYSIQNYIRHFQQIVKEIPITTKVQI